MKQHSTTKPIEEWPPARLKLECANIFNNAEFLILTDNEKKRMHYPITREEMIDCIKRKGSCQ